MIEKKKKRGKRGLEGNITFNKRDLSRPLKKVKEGREQLPVTAQVGRKTYGTLWTMNQKE